MGDAFHLLIPRYSSDLDFVCGTFDITRECLISELIKLVIKENVLEEENEGEEASISFIPAVTKKHAIF